MPHKSKSERLAYFRDYNARNRANRNAQAESCRQRQPDKRLGYWRNYNRANSVKRVEAVKLWKQRNPARHRALQSASRMRRRAAQKNATISPQLIARFILSVRSKRWAICYYCGNKVASRLVQFDHVVALQGFNPGAHEIGNLAVSCGKCNRSKSNLSLPAWKRDGQQLLPL